MSSQRVDQTSTDEVTVFQTATLPTADRHFSTLFALSMDAVLLVDAQGQILDVNSATSDLLKLSHEECIGRSLSGFIEPANASAHHWQTLLQQSEGTWQFIRTDHARLTVNYRLTETFASGCFMVILRDVTEQHQLQQQVQQQQKYQTLFEILPIGVCITDAAGQIVEANPASEQILGVSTTEQTRRTLDAASWQLMRPDGTPMAASECASVLISRPGFLARSSRL
jgi:PAS domain S-box-containing protein